MSNFTAFAALLAAGFSIWRIGRRLRFFLHMHQLEGYGNRPYLERWFGKPFDAFVRWSHVAGFLIWMAFVWLELPAAVALLAWTVAFASSRRYRRDRPKKPLVWTPRMKRQAVAAGILPAVLVGGSMALAGFLWVTGTDPSVLPVLLVLIGLGMADLNAPVSVLLASMLMAPVEYLLREGFKRSARARLAARPDLTIVAITGSYGKTSVKFAVAEVLGQRFQVLATPGSFNTPMGICKVINNDLRDHHQILILEMGIRRPGDIAELCAIVRPHYAVVTGVGIAHLESMGSPEAIAREKGSLLDYLLPGGKAVLNGDDLFYSEMASKAPHLSVSALPYSSVRADLVASHVQFDSTGTHFTVTSGTQTAGVSLQLLGRHHVGNALLALAVGQLLGVRLRSGAHALARLKPVPHRLSVREEAGLTILDDAFNSNPVGARNAVEVLGAFAPRGRFMITPGMVELGERELEENQALGAFMVGRVDQAILVGPARTAAISAGLREAGMPPERVHIVSTLFEAREVLRQLAQPGDVVLYENDLPDQYTEA
ncbi:MAG: UDP-N-acetylmuramoyl-tripeptide--D-alanyl-D-alanine ligase [Thalassolituus oleivorans]|jgi:UDP-N-acetylmuramoyl-tripeptide--D-alanyl-D-alanine ligase